MQELPREVGHSGCDTREASKLSMQYFLCVHVYIIHRIFLGELRA